MNIPNHLFCSGMYTDFFQFIKEEAPYVSKMISIALPELDQIRQKDVAGLFYLEITTSNKETLAIINKENEYLDSAVGSWISVGDRAKVQIFDLSIFLSTDEDESILGDSIQLKIDHAGDEANIEKLLSVGFHSDRTTMVKKYADFSPLLNA